MNVVMAGVELVLITSVAEGTVEGAGTAGETENGISIAGELGITEEEVAAPIPD